MPSWPRPTLADTSSNQPAEAAGLPGWAGAGEGDLVERLAAVLQQDNAAGADQAQVGLAVAVDVQAADRLRLRIDAGQRRQVGEAGHAADADEVLAAAPADEVALGVVVL